MSCLSNNPAGVRMALRVGAQCQDSVHDKAHLASVAPYKDLNLVLNEDNNEWRALKHAALYFPKSLLKKYCSDSWEFKSAIKVQQGQCVKTTLSSVDAV